MKHIVSFILLSVFVSSSNAEILKIPFNRIYGRTPANYSVKNNKTGLPMMGNWELMNEYNNSEIYFIIDWETGKFYVQNEKKKTTIDYGKIYDEYINLASTSIIMERIKDAANHNIEDYTYKIFSTLQVDKDLPVQELALLSKKNGDCEVYMLLTGYIQLKLILENTSINNSADSILINNNTNSAQGKTITNSRQTKHVSTTPSTTQILKTYIDSLFGIIDIDSVLSTNFEKLVTRLNESLNIKGALIGETYFYYPIDMPFLGCKVKFMTISIDKYDTLSWSYYVEFSKSKDAKKFTETVVERVNFLGYKLEMCGADEYYNYNAGEFNNYRRSLMVKYYKVDKDIYNVMLSVHLTKQ